MKKVLFILLSAVLLFSTFSCAQTQEYGAEAKSDKAYDSSPTVSDSVLAELVKGNNEFAFDLYRQLAATKEGNFFYSPYSISLALAMTYAGANGQTEEQMAETLKFLLENEELHKAFNKLSIELNSRNEVPENSEAQGFELNIVNATWGQRGFEFMQAFLDVLAENYDAGIRLLDYEKEPEACRKVINDWVYEQTNGKIEDLIPEGAISEITRLVLTNAIYFNAAWLHQFNEDYTYNDTFYLPDGTTVSVPMMHQTDKFSYINGDDYTAIELLYDIHNMSMVIIMPDEGTFTDFENSLTAEVIDGILHSMNYGQVNLSMPKFEFESDFSLKAALKAMGMTDAFSDFADFSGITDKTDLIISDIIHKAFVSVDEEGTEAAAATAVIFIATSMPIEIGEVNINHSFIFLIRDITTGSTLFIGRVINPAV
ncbi:MAG: serpin family protein [Dehalococcoidales bacterium]|nr:serpin family protein [Dehalococcoidales bacterium]